MTPSRDPRSLFSAAVQSTSHVEEGRMKAPPGKSYVQLAEQAFFVAFFSGFLVMAGGFVSHVLSVKTSDDTVCASAKPIAKPAVKSAKC